MDSHRKVKKSCLDVNVLFVRILCSWTCKWTSRLSSFPNREKYQGVIIYRENTFSCLVVIKKNVTMNLVTLGFRRVEWIWSTSSITLKRGKYVLLFLLYSWKWIPPSHMYKIWWLPVLLWPIQKQSSVVHYMSCNNLLYLLYNWCSCPVFSGAAVELQPLQLQLKPGHWESKGHQEEHSINYSQDAFDPGQRSWSRLKCVIMFEFCY